MVPTWQREAEQRLPRTDAKLSTGDGITPDTVIPTGYHEADTAYQNPHLPPARADRATEAVIPTLGGISAAVTGAGAPTGLFAVVRPTAEIPRTLGMTRRA
jgi:hypothetical protein